MQVVIGVGMKWKLLTRLREISCLPRTRSDTARAGLSKRRIISAAANCERRETIVSKRYIDITF